MPTHLLSGARSFICACVLIPTLNAVSFAAPKPVIPPPVTPADISPADPVRAELLAELRAAKASQDVSALRAAEERRGTVVVTSVQTPPAKIRVFAPDGSPRGGDGTRWSGDVCITCPETVAGDAALAAGTDGTLYAAALSADAHSIFVFRSTNGGETWQPIVVTSADALLGEPCLAVGEGNTNRLLCAYVLGSDTPLSSLQVLTLDLDTGSTGVATALSLPGNVVAHPRICVDSPEWAQWYPYVVCVTRGIDAAVVRFTRSLDYGAQWTAPVILAGWLTVTDRVDVDFGGSTLTVAYSDPYPDSDVMLCISRDFGATFEAPFPVTSAGYEETEPRIATTTSGDMTLVVFARQYGPGNRDIDCVWSSNAGVSWNGSYLPYSSQDERRPAVIASPVTGRLHAAYSCGSEIRSTEADLPLPGNWGEPRVVNDAAASSVAWPAITLRPVPCGCHPDMNCDGVINANDIGPFNLAMTDPSAYMAAYPACDISQADTDCDGDIDASDLERLLCLIAGLPDCCPDPSGDAGIAWLNDGPFAPGIWFDYASSWLPDLTAVPPVAAPAAGILQVRPSPFTTRTTIGFVLPAAGHCRLEIFSAAGRRVAILRDGPCDAGSYTYTWDGRDDRDRACAPAVYFCRFEVNGCVETRCLALVR